MHVQPGIAASKKTMKHKYQILQNNTVCSWFIPPDTSRHHTFPKDAVASSGCQSRTIKSQHHAQDCQWRSSMLSYWVLVWSVRCMMLRQDIERCLSPCHPCTGRNGSKAFKLNGIKSWNKLPFKIKNLNSLASFKQAMRLYLIDRLVSEYNSDFLYY